MAGYNNDRGFQRDKVSSNTKITNGKRPFNGGNNNGSEEVQAFMNSHSFNLEWIQIGANTDMVTYCEEAGNFMARGRENEKLTTSQIRNVFGELKRIQLKGYDTQDGKTSFILLKPKVAYAEGRLGSRGLKLFRAIFDKAWSGVNNSIQFNNFCNFIEAILAYHRANGGK